MADQDCSLDSGRLLKDAPRQALQEDHFYNGAFV